jgi:hypothetical protein
LVLSFQPGIKRGLLRGASVLLKKIEEAHTVLKHILSATKDLITPTPQDLLNMTKKQL